MYSLDFYRQNYPNTLGGLSDTDAVYKIAELAGENPQDLAVHFGLVDPEQGDFTRGISSGVDSMQAGGYGLAGYAGDVVGADSVRDWGYEGFKENMDLVNLRAKEYDQFENIDSFGEGVDSAQYWLGYALPQIVEAVVGSKGGTYLGRKAVETQVRKKVVDRFGEDKADAIMMSKPVQAAIDKGRKVGSYTGIGTQAVGTELGHTYGGAVEEAIHQGGTIDDVDLGDVTLYGGLAGAAEFGTDVLTLGLAKVGPAKNLIDKAGKSTSRTVNATTRGLAGGTAEAGTEMVQTGLEEMGAGKSFEEANFSDPTSAWAGFIGGGAMGLGGGLATRPKDKPTNTGSDEQLSDASNEADLDAQQQADDILQERQQAEIEQQQMEAEIDAIKTKRQEHVDKFPDEDVWYKLDEADFNMQQRMDLANPESELGQIFRQWQKDNDIYDNNDKVFKQFLNDYNVTPNSEQKKESYLNALDSFVEYQEEKASRSPEEQVRIGNELESMIDAYNDAVSDGDLMRINSIEAQASGMFHPAEWAEAKRNNAIQDKGVKDAKKVRASKGEKIPAVPPAGNIETAETNTAPIEEVTEEQVSANPWTGTRSKAKATFWDKAAGVLGENFEVDHPELSAHFGKDIFSTAKADKALNKIVAEMEQQKAEELVVDDAKQAEGDLDTTQVDVKEAEANLSHPKETFVFNFLLDAAENGELSRYYELKDGKARWFGTTLADDMFARYGDEKMAEYEFKNNKDSRKRLNEVAKRIAERSEEIRSARKEQLKTRGNVAVKKSQATVEATEEQLQAAANDTKSGITISRSGDTGAGVGKLDKGTEAWVDKKAEEANKAEEAKTADLVARKKKIAVSKPSKAEADSFNEEVDRFLLDNPGAKTKVAAEFNIIDAVAKSLNNKDLTRKASSLWNRYRTDKDLTYSKVPNEVKFEWVQSVGTYISNKDVDALKSDLQAAEAMAAEIAVEAEAETVTDTETKEVKDGKTDSRGRVESEKSSEGPSVGSEESSEGRSEADTKAGKNAGGVVRKQKARKPVVPKLDIEEGTSKEEHYKSMTRKDLYAMAKLLGLDVKARHTKSQLVEKLVNKNVDYVKERDRVMHRTKKLDPNWVITEPGIVGAIGADNFVLANQLIDEALAEKTETRALRYAKKSKADQVAQGRGELQSDKQRLEKASTKMDMAHALTEFGVELGSSTEESIAALMKLPKKDLSAMVADALQQVKASLRGGDSKSVKRTKSMKSEGQTVDTPTSKGEIRKQFVRLLGEKTFEKFAKNRVHFVNSEKEAAKVYEGLILDAIKALGSKNLSAQQIKELRQYTQQLANVKATGISDGSAAFVTPGMGGRPNVVFIVPRIQKGDEMAVFMHEVGAHIGMENVFSAKKYKAVVKQIKQWADSNDNSQESRLAKKAKAIVAEGTKNKKIPSAQADSELVAYFLTEAVRDGAVPGNDSTVGSLLHRFKQAFLKFLRIISGKDVSLTTQNIVDMAYGAAGIELTQVGATKDSAVRDKDGNISYMHVIDPKTNKEEVKTTRDWIREKFGETSTKVWDDSVEVWRSGMGSTKFLHQFINEVKERMPSADKWHQAILTAERTRNEIKQAVEDIAVRAREMADSDLVVANKFIYDSTFHQKWGYNPYDESNPKYLTVKVDSAMAKRFDALNANQQQLVKDIFSHGHNMLKRKQEIAKLFGVNKEFFGVSGLDGPYAPLKRFGNYVTEFKSQVLIDAEKAFADKPNNINRKNVDNLKSNANHYVISFHSSMGKAKNFVDRNKYKFASAVASPKTEVLTEGRSPDHAVLSKVLGGLGASGLDKGSREYKAIEQMVRDMYFETLDEDNARRSQAKRMNRAGAEENMVRAFLANATAEANLVASMEHGAEINTALAEASNEKNADKEHLGRIYNMMVSHYVEHLNNKQTPIQDRLAAMNTVYMLTSSVGYHITNATQPIMVTIPKIVGDFGGYFKVIRKLAKGYRIARTLVNFDVKNLQTGIDISKAPKKYQALLKDLNLRQLLDVGIEQDLSELNRTDTGYHLINKGSEKASNVAHRLYQVARLVEAYNRISSAVAAYDMAAANPSVVEAKNMTAAEYATNIVEDTQGNFSAIDAPLILKKLPKITGQYRKYQIMMAWVYADATKKAFAGTSAEEKAAGRRTMGYALWHASLFSGATGVPVLGWIAPMFLGMGEGDEPQDLERWIRANVGDEKFADLLTRGLPAVVGLDMSTKLSQQKIFHPLPYTDFAADQASLKGAVFDFLLGPFGTTASNFMRSAEYAQEGNLYRATEYALPKGVRTAMESYRLATEGYSLRNGDVVADPDDFSGMTIAFNALGIPATEITKLKWSRGQQFEIKEWFEKEQSKIRKRYVDAYKAKDSAGKKEWRQKWLDLQKSKDRVRPFFHDNRKELKKTPLSSLLKAPQRQQTRERNYRRSLGTD